MHEETTVDRRLLTALVGKGYRGRVVSARHAAELREGIEFNRREGRFDKEFDGTRLSSPAELAAKIRTRAVQILRKPNTRRKQRVEAEGMIEFAGELEKVDDLKDLPDGIMAVKIGEAYRELDNRPKGRKAA